MPFQAQQSSKYGANLPPVRQNARRIYVIVLAGGAGASCGRCMTKVTDNLPPPEGQRRYVWPWFVLAAVVLGIALAVLWMSKEIERTRRIRDLNAPPSSTKHGAIASPSSPVVNWEL
jgi:hypothetical protein